jgi:hypothetical protein
MTSAKNDQTLPVFRYIQKTSNKLVLIASLAWQRFYQAGRKAGHGDDKTLMMMITTMTLKCNNVWRFLLDEQTRSIDWIYDILSTMTTRTTDYTQSANIICKITPHHLKR